MNYQQDMLFAKKFMSALADDFLPQKRAFIVVSHINPTSIPFITTLAQHGRVAGVIAKPNSIHFPTYDKLHEVVPFLDITKHDCLQPDIINKKIAPLIKSDENLTIIDIGGYFAGALKQLNNLPNLVSIVEDTENGLQKYEKILQSYTTNKIPILSVARSRAKDFEDYLIGRSIVASTLSVMQKESGENFRQQNIGIIGFGEVGRGAAFYLKEHEKVKVTVFDTNPNTQRLARNSGFAIANRADILANSDLLFCMTGNKSLSDTDIQLLKPNCSISSCTSSDDEFGFSSFDITSGIKKTDNIRNTAGINFVNDGNAVNFLHPQNLEKMLSPYIYLTHSALLKSVVALNNGGDYSITQVNSLNKETEKELISSFRQSIKKFNQNTNFINSILKNKIGNKSKS